MSARSVAPLAIALLAAACSPAPEPSTPQPRPAPTPSTTPAPTPSSAAPAPLPSAAPAAASPAAASPAPWDTWTGEPARETMAPGLAPLTDEEAVEADKKCKPMQEALAAAARKLKGKPATDAVLEVLANPPAVKGVDVPRCATLIRRDLVAYRATSLESEAIQQLKIIASGLQSALEAPPHPFCASAPAVPADLSKLEGGAYKSAPEEWQKPGWQCLRFSLGTPQLFQYRFEADGLSQSFVVVARGYPVAGKQPPVELFLRGKVEGRTIKAGEVLRRR